MTTDTHGQCATPACRSATPGGCSDCTLSYDCQRAATGVPLAWPVIALSVVAVAWLASTLFGG